MSDEQLKAVSPIDGRYSKKVQHLREIFSESALMRYRVIAEITWLQYLSDCDQMDQIPSMDSQLKAALIKIHTDFSLSDAKKIKEIENLPGVKGAWGEVLGFAQYIKIVDGETVFISNGFAPTFGAAWDTSP